MTLMERHATIAKRFYEQYLPTEKVFDHCGSEFLFKDEEDNLISVVVQYVRKEKDFVLCSFLRIEDCTKAELEYVEAYVRMKLERIYQHTQNDHFEFEMKGKAEAYNTFINTALNYGIEICNREGFKYTVVHTKVFGKRMGEIEKMIAQLLSK